ncbi:MAG: TrkH family potassium uptake protein [Thermoguttaceae bacterium]|nr:TrkH family potassium uptake protein [Thermoguttaceae bacterium]
MIFSLPWSLPIFGVVESFDPRGFWGIGGAAAATAAVGSLFALVGYKHRKDPLFRKEALAVVGLAWILATVLGALPFLFSRTCGRRDAEGRPVPLSLVDAIFESASGFTDTGASILTDVEDPQLVPRSVLFWRSESHFIGGLGIIVLFVAILGVGSASRALMQSEIPALAQTRPYALSQHTAWVFGGIYLGLTFILVILLVVAGLGPFEALCHAFGTVATGGFSTRNASIAAFGNWAVELFITLFMILGSTNFVLLYWLVYSQPKRLLVDPEFRTYLFVIALAILVVGGMGFALGDFPDPVTALRKSAFQVVAIISTTGFTIDDFDQWNTLSRAILLTLMFVGGCSCSTSGSLKVIRHLLLSKILRLELERTFRPNVVRHIRVGARVIQEPEIRVQILVYFSLIAIIFLAAWLALVAVEPDRQWASATGLAALPKSVESSSEPPGTVHADPVALLRAKLVDCASAVATCLNGVGPGLGFVGPARNFADLQPMSKLVLVAVMLLGRLEVYPILVLFSLRFWRRI